VLARTVKKAGLEAVERDGYVVEHALTLTFHNLRYSDGSALIAAGRDIEEISARALTRTWRPRCVSMSISTNRHAVAMIAATGSRLGTPPMVAAAPAVGASLRGD
jgi:hypothetical protein